GIRHHLVTGVQTCALPISDRKSGESIMAKERTHFCCECQSLSLKPQDAARIPYLHTNVPRPTPNKARRVLALPIECGCPQPQRVIGRASCRGRGERVGVDW